MINIQYTIENGVLPITVELIDSLSTVYDTNVHVVYGSYEFTNVPDGEYTLRFTDDDDCVSESPIDMCVDCPPGYEPVGDECVLYDEQPAHYTSPTYIVARKSSNNSYGSYGTLIFDSWNYDGTGTYEHVITPYWTNDWTSNGPMNRTCIWSSYVTNLQDIAFSFCINIGVAKTYYVGFACDNWGKIKLNGTTILEQDVTALTSMIIANGEYYDGYPDRIPFRYWYVYPIEFSAGQNVIEVIGHNEFSTAAVGIQIYNATDYELASATQDSDLGDKILFDSVDLVGETLFYEYSTAEGYHGYYCDEDYALDTCGETIKCIKKWVTPCGVVPDDCIIGDVNISPITTTTTTSSTTTTTTTTIVPITTTTTSSTTSTTTTIADIVYYVSNTGDDLDDGLTPETAWATIAEVNSNTFNAGESVLFNRGDMWRGETIEIQWSGTEGNPIVFGAYGTGDKPILNGAEIVTDWTLTGTTNVWSTPSINGSTKATDVAVVIDDDRFLPVDALVDLSSDLEFYADDLTGSVNDKIYVYSTTDPATRTAELSAQTIGISNDGITGTPQTNITIMDLEFRYYGYAGIEARGTAPNGNYLIDNCDFYFNKNDAVQFYRGFENNVIQNCTANYCGNGFYANEASNNSFIDNTITNTIRYSLAAGFTDGHAIGLWTAKNSLVEGNYVEGGEGPVFGNDKSSGITRYNEIHAGAPNAVTHNALGGNLIEAGDTMSYYYNIVFADDADTYCFLQTTIEGTLNVYNNTFVQQGSGINRAIRVVTAGNDLATFKNNIVYRADGSSTYIYEVYTSGTIISDNNILFTGGSMVWDWDVGVSATLSIWQTNSGNDLNSANSDPLFTTDFTDLQLQTGSPAINAGVDVGLTRDILGNPIVGNPDIGAYEKQ